MRNTHRPCRFPSLLAIRCPEILPEAIEAAAQQKLTSPAEYVRQTLLAQLRADGIDLHSCRNGLALEAEGSDSVTGRDYVNDVLDQ